MKIFDLFLLAPGCDLIKPDCWRSEQQENIEVPICDLCQMLPEPDSDVIFGWLMDWVTATLKRHDT